MILHGQARQDHLPAPDAFQGDHSRDVLVLAGDIGRYLLARDFVLRELALSRVIYVPGNHEYYGLQNRETVDGLWKALAAVHQGLHYLVAEGVMIEGVRFWRAPWYSNLWGADDGWTQLEVHLDPRGTECAWTAMLRAQAGNVDVVITHWPPTRDATHPKFEGDSLNPYFYQAGREFSVLDLTPRGRGVRRTG